MKKIHSSLYPLIGAALIGSAFTTPAQACSSDPYIGSVCATAATFCPAPNYMEANGQPLAISQYAPLYSLIGTYYGGNGNTTFALPDLRGRSAIGAGQGSGLSNVILGQARGSETNTLSVNNLPPHNHTASYATAPGGSLKASTSAATTTTPSAGTFLATSAPAVRGGPETNIYSTDAGSQVNLNGLQVSGGTIAIGNTGSGSPVNNIPPQLALKYCIAVTGIYPSRP